MPDLLSKILLPLTLGSLALLLVLTLALVLERVARNRRESRARTRRMGYEEVLNRGRSSEIHALAAEASQSYAARCDLVDSLARTAWSTGPVFATDDGLRRAATHDTTDRDVARRAVGAAVLSVIGGTEAVALLESLLRQDPDLELRLIAARSLRVLGDDDGARALIRSLRDGLLPTARILEQLGRPFAAGPLLDALWAVENRPVRAEIAEALGLAGHLPAASALAGLVRTGDPSERTKACRALGRLGDPVVVPLLARVLDDEAWIVRAQAATALGACAHASAVAPLARALGDRNWWVRANSATSLRLCGDAGRAALRRAATGHPDRYARDRALEALAMDDAARTLQVAA